jgi:hypothetical protein
LLNPHLPSRKLVVVYVIGTAGMLCEWRMGEGCLSRRHTPSANVKESIRVRLC